MIVRGAVSIAVLTFQFLKGAIKCGVTETKLNVLSGFQFLKGAIK